VNFLRNIDNATIDAWRYRLNDIEDALLPTRSDARRKRRGLLDVVGQLSHSLFGAATDSDVECKRQIEILRTRDRRVFHSVSHIIPIVNQTHTAVKQNRQHINALQMYVDKVSADVIYIANVWQKHDKLLQVVKTKLRIEQCLSAMESANAYWLQQLAKFNRQKASLELS